MTLKRVDYLYRGKPGHRYELDGERVDGVTTILSNGIPKPAIPRWASRSVGEYVAENLDTVAAMLETGGPGPTTHYLANVPWQKRDDAAVRGTEVHALAEQLILGGEVDVPAHLVGHVQGYSDWLDRSGATPLLTEFVVASRSHKYAGTADLIIDVPGVGAVIADIKTSKGVYGETALQLAAYRWAEFYLDDDGNEAFLPATGVVGLVLHVTATGTEAYPVPVDQDQFLAFIHAQEVARWAKGSRDLVGQPIRFDKEDAA